MAIEMTSPRSPNHGLNLFVLGSGCSQLFHLGHRGAQSSLQVLCGGGLWTASWAPFSTNVCHHYVVSIVMGFPNSSINGGTSKAGWLVDFMENPIYTNGWWLRVPLWLRKPPCISMSSSPFLQDLWNIVKPSKSSVQASVAARSSSCCCTLATWEASCSSQTGFSERWHTGKPLISDPWMMPRANGVNPIQNW